MWCPAGISLRPLLFLLYLTDICNSSDKLSFDLFADGSNPVYAYKNLRSLEITVTEDLRSIGNWLMANKLSLIVKKYNVVIFRPIKSVLIKT